LYVQSIISVLDSFAILRQLHAKLVNVPQQNILSLQSTVIEFTCPVLKPLATDVAIVQLVFKTIILCEEVPLNEVNAHHNTSFPSDNCFIVKAQEFGHVHTLVVNVVSIVQSVLYLTILFCVVHHICVNAHDITTLPSACWKMQDIVLFGKNKLVFATSAFKSVSIMCSLVETQPLYVHAVFIVTNK
jgi:hypothetical protein